jgi:hypothetical protein
VECDDFLYSNNLFYEDKISQINMDLVPLEDDLLSLEQPDNFAHHMLQDDDIYKVYVQQSVHRLEAVYGRIGTKMAIGKISQQIINRVELNTLNIDQGSGGGLVGQEQEIDGLIMIDRDVDPITPFCCNQTYEGFLDEFFGIQVCNITVQNSVVYPDEKVRKEKNIPENGTTDLTLTNEDSIFKEIRNKHFNVISNILNNRIMEIQTLLDDKSQQDYKQIEEYFKKIKALDPVKSFQIASAHVNLKYHIGQAMKEFDYPHIYKLEMLSILGEDLKTIHQMLETKMTKQYDRLKILRALVLLSVTQGGIA